jgi:hypothetical protein
VCLAFAVTLLGVTRCLLFKISCESRLIFRPVLSLVLTHLTARSDAHVRVAHSHTAFGTRCLTIFPQSPLPPLLSCCRVYCALLVFDVFTRLRDIIGPSSLPSQRPRWVSSRYHPHHTLLAVLAISSNASSAIPTLNGKLISS